jgi:serine/threonine protein kinase
MTWLNFDFIFAHFYRNWPILDFPLSLNMTWTNELHTVGQQILLLRTQTFFLVLQNREIVERIPYNFKTDMWSLGVVLFFFLTGSLPFEVRESIPKGEISEKTLAKVKEAKFHIPAYLSKDAQDLLSKMLVKVSKSYYKFLPKIESSNAA